LFERKDADIHVELPVTLAEAVLGGKVTVPTVTGPVTMTVPKGSNTGTVLRLREKGVPAGKSGKRGDQYVRLKVVLPDRPDAELEAFVREWSAKHPYDARAKLASLAIMTEAVPARQLGGPKRYQLHRRIEPCLRRTERQCGYD